jgi:hypothetical protein
VLTFCTFTNRSRHPSGSVDVSRSTREDQVSKVRRLVVAIGDRQDVDLDRHGGVSRMLILVEASEDRLRADHDHLRSLDDLAGRPDGGFQLVATHQLAI